MRWVRSQQEEEEHTDERPDGTSAGELEEAV